MHCADVPKAEWMISSWLMHICHQCAYAQTKATCVGLCVIHTETTLLTNTHGRACIQQTPRRGAPACMRMSRHAQDPSLQNFLYAPTAAFLSPPWPLSTLNVQRAMQTTVDGICSAVRCHANF